MVYLEETFNLTHASLEAIDNFVEFVKRKFIPVCSRLGGHLIAAWTSDVEWFCQVRHIIEFDSIEALKQFRINCSLDSAWGKYTAELEEHALVRSSRLLELFGAVSSEAIHSAISRSNADPAGGYLQANLEVAPERMNAFHDGLTSANETLPPSCQIIASWKPVSGGPNEVINIWRAPKPINAYQPADDDSKAFFRYVRQLAPKERAIRMLTLPYSPLK